MANEVSLPYRPAFEKYWQTVYRRFLPATVIRHRNALSRGLVNRDLRRDSIIMAMVSNQGTACSETALVGAEDTPAAREKIERECCRGREDDPMPGSWRDCTEGLSEYLAQDEAA